MAWLTQFKGVWWGEREAAPVAAFGFVAACLALATLARWGISNIRADVPFSLYYPVALLTTVFGGLYFGIFAAAVGAVLGTAIDFADAPTGSARIALLAIYVVVSSLIIWGGQHYRSIALYYRDMSNRLQQEEDYRKLVVGELSHRLKNAIATIQAVVQQVLRDHPEMSAAVADRLQALSATDDLVAKSDRGGCDIAELLRLETAPYGDARVTLLGHALHIPPKLAVSLGLMFHELATNAAKYGALSTPGGFLQISWRMVGGRLSVIWDENNGPPVTPPQTAGFGTRLLGKALNAFDGQVQLDYLSAGLHCTISCRIPPE